jgi:ABC-2 type transport system ATP-binding protein
MIELTGLTKQYGSTLAVDHLNLRVEKGEIFGFIGPNGAGKTTTIRMMAGVLGPTEGTVRIDGIPMATDPEAAKRIIGFIPDRPFLYEKLTGMEFMRFVADLYGCGGGLFQSKAERLLIQFSLYDWADHLIEAYSHGMKQRLIIASALLHEPRVIIVDEPMVGLDPAGIRMVNRIGVIHRGRLVALGTTGDLRGTALLKEGDLEEVFLRLTGKDHHE